MSRPRLITKAAYARHRGISRVAVHQAVIKGWISVIDGKIDPVKADKQWAKAALPRAGQGAKPVRKAHQAARKPADAGPKQGTYLDARTQREQVNAELAALDLKERTGKLMDIDTAQERIRRAARAARDLVLGFPDRTVPRLVGQSGDEMMRILSEEAHRICTVISNAPTL